MPSFHPQAIVIHENNPETIDHYRIQARSETEEVLCDGTYPSGPGQDTNIPIGSNGFFNNLTSGTTVKMYVFEMFLGVSGPEQFAGHKTVTAMMDGAENISFID